MNRHHELVLALRLKTVHILGADGEDPHEGAEDHGARSQTATGDHIQAAVRRQQVARHLAMNNIRCFQLQELKGVQGVGCRVPCHRREGQGKPSRILFQRQDDQEMPGRTLCKRYYDQGVSGRILYKGCEYQG